MKKEKKRKDHQIQTLREVAFHLAMSVKDDFALEQTEGRKNALRIDIELNHVRDHMTCLDWFNKVVFGSLAWDELEAVERERLRLIFEIYSWSHDRGKWFLFQIMPRILASKAGKRVKGYVLEYDEVMKRLNLSKGEKEIFERALKVYEDGLEMGAYSLLPDIAHHIIGAYDLLAREDMLLKLSFFDRALVLLTILGTQFEGYYRPWTKRLGYSQAAQEVVWAVKTKDEAGEMLKRYYPEASDHQVDLVWGLLRLANDSDKVQMVNIGSLVLAEEGSWVRLGGAFKILTYTMRSWFAQSAEIGSLEDVFNGAITTARRVMGVELVDFKKCKWRQVDEGELLTESGKEFTRDRFGLFLEFRNAILTTKRYRSFREMIEMYANHCEGAKDTLEAARANAEVAIGVLKQAFETFLKERNGDLTEASL